MQAGLPHLAGVTQAAAAFNASPTASGPEPKGAQMITDLVMHLRSRSPAVISVQHPACSTRGRRSVIPTSHATVRRRQPVARGVAPLATQAWPQSAPWLTAGLGAMATDHQLSTGAHALACWQPRRQAVVADSIADVEARHAPTRCCWWRRHLYLVDALLDLAGESPR